MLFQWQDRWSGCYTKTVLVCWGHFRTTTAMCFRSKPTQFSKTISYSTTGLTERISSPAHDWQRFVQLCWCWRMQLPLGQTVDSRITFSGLLSLSVWFSIMSLVVASYLEILLQYINSWCDLEPLFFFAYIHKEWNFHELRQETYLQIWTQSIAKLSENKHNYSYCFNCCLENPYLILN